MFQKKLLALLVPFAAMITCGVVACAGSDQVLGDSSNLDPDAGPGLLGDAGGHSDGSNSLGAGDGGPTSDLVGTVWAPNQTVPIEGALVYLTNQKPDAMPQGVYCDKCVQLSMSQYTLSGPDGTFDLPTALTGKQFLVVQKGGFRVVTELTIKPGKNQLADGTTSLPAKTNAALGQEVPKMTVVAGQYDDIEDSLQKLGIDPAAIDIKQSALIGQAAKAFLTDINAVLAQQIIFLPCGDYTQGGVNIDLSSDPTIQANLAAFVQKGGRLYVTDWHYDFINRTFPGFVQWAGASSTACSGCLHNSYDAPATVEDKSLGSWLSAQSISSFTLLRNYTTITGVSPVSDAGAGDGGVVTPKVWVRSKQAGMSTATPATVSFEYGCGRVMYSTYHAEPATLALTPQERALLGVLLDVSVCNESSSGVIVK
jgi:hypothetical protein